MTQIKRGGGRTLQSKNFEIYLTTKPIKFEIITLHAAGEKEKPPKPSHITLYIIHTNQFSFFFWLETINR